MSKSSLQRELDALRDNSPRKRKAAPAGSKEPSPKKAAAKKPSPRKPSPKKKGVKKTPQKPSPKKAGTRVCAPEGDYRLADMRQVVKKCVDDGNTRQDREWTKVELNAAGYVDGDTGEVCPTDNCLRVVELRKLAKKGGVEGYGKMTRDELIEALQDD